LREDGLEVDDKLVFQAGRSIEDGAKAALQLINESSDATAIQTVNDMIAVGCIETLVKQGLRVPRTFQWWASEISSWASIRACR